MTLFEEETRKDPQILGFFGDYRFLSNFHICDCVFEDLTFPSSEHVYMFQKSLDESYRSSIIKAPTPKTARQIGQTVKLRSDWNNYRKLAMLNALNSKFKNSQERKMLKATGDAYLEETNTWNDTYWGVCNCVGENMLGRLLMQIRDTIR